MTDKTDLQAWNFISFPLSLIHTYNKWTLMLLKKIQPSSYILKFIIWCLHCSVHVNILVSTLNVDSFFNIK